jgi:hypothetical protein
MKVNTPMSGLAMGRWAFFPEGGSVHISNGFGVSITKYSLPTFPDLSNQWVLLGNPFTHGPAIATSGVGELLGYDPALGYHRIERIPRGHAAWAWVVSGQRVVVEQAVASEAL